MLSVLLAAGHGSRLKSLLGNKPKSLLEIEGKPLLQHQLANLQSVGVSSTILVVRPDHVTAINQILSYTSTNISTTIVACESASAFQSFCCARSLARGKRFILLMIDSIFQEKDLEEFGSRCTTLADDFLLGGTSYIYDEKPSYIVVNESRQIIRVGRNYKSKLVTAGIYCCPPDFYEFVDEAVADRINSMTDYLGFYVREKRHGIPFLFSKMMDIDTPEDVHLVMEWLKSKKQ